MPVYEFLCPKCGYHCEAIKDMGDNDHDCVGCDAKMDRILSPARINMGAAGAYGYFDENLGTYIHTNRQRREEMGRQGVTEKGATPKNGQVWV